MVKLKLTKPWENRIHSESSFATWHQCYLICEQGFYYRQDEYVGTVRIGNFSRSGKTRRSAKAAKQDAERLAVELLRDIRDGAKALLEQHGMGEDD